MNHTSRVYRYFLSRSLKDSIKELRNKLRELIHLACIWRYHLCVLKHSKFSDVGFYFFGLKLHQEAATSMLDLDYPSVTDGRSRLRAFISVIPLPGSIRIPHNLTSIITLKNKSIDEVLMGFEKSKRRSVANAASGFLLKQVTEIKDVTRLNEEMLIPYASARHGKAVVQLQLEFVMGMAFKYGQLHLLLENTLEVGCLIGYESIRNNKRYWLMYREGFPDFVFNDKNNHREKHIIIIYLQLEWAINNGFDYYDMGSNQAFTERGAAHFKRTLGAELSTRGSYNYFYLKLPQRMAAKFYWEKPVFAVDGKNIVLHLGLLDGISADEVANRYKLLNYGGLSKIYLHCDSKPSSIHVKSVMDIYRHQKTPPALKVCLFKGQSKFLDWQ